MRDASIVLNEFKRLDSIENKRIYNTADSLFAIGETAACLAFISDIKLSKEDAKNAKNRRLKARLHSINFEFEEAAINFEKAVTIFEDFENLTACIEFYYSIQKADKQLFYLQKAQKVAASVDEKTFTTLHLFLLKKNNLEKEAAAVLLTELEALIAASDHKTLTEKRALRAALLLEKADLLKNVYNKQQQALDYAVEAVERYQRILKDNDEYTDSFLSAIYTQALILKYMRRYQDSYELCKTTYTAYAKQLEQSKENKAFFEQLLGIVSKELKQYEEAISYNLLTVQYMDSIYKHKPNIGALQGLCHQYYNLANMYLFKKDYQASIRTYHQALEHFQEIYAIDSTSLENLNFLGMLTNNRGKAFEKSNELHKALNDYHKAFSYFDARVNFIGKSIYDDNLVNATQNIANTYVLLNKNYEALAYFRTTIRQINILMPTEPPYWQAYMHRYAIKLAECLYHNYQDTKLAGYLIEAHRHIRGAKIIVDGNKALKNNKEAGVELKEIYQKVVNQLYPFSQRPFDATTFINKLSLKEVSQQFSEIEDDDFLAAIIKNNATEAQNRIARKRSPFYQSLDEREEEIDQFEYAYWRSISSILALKQQDFSTALSESKLAATHSKHTDFQVLAVVMLIINKEKKEALKTLQSISLSKSEKTTLLQQVFKALSDQQLYQIELDDLNDFLKKVK